MKSLNWRIGYAVFCLAFVVWVVYLSLNNFEMVHSDYRWAGEQLQPAKVKEIAIQELIKQCRKESKRMVRPSATTGDTCLSWPTIVLEERQKAVEKRLVGEQGQAKTKLVLFYIFFGVIFIILPLVIVYLLLSFFIWIYRNITFVK